MPYISEKQLRIMKKACYAYDCFECMHVSDQRCIEGGADSCDKCTIACACHTCKDGSNWQIADKPKGAEND